ncbi:hypothetical protein L4C33_04105 [Vibrio makurazakiensis]|uniref:hypothetical protein n=1 Tax=Vibrio makurazakiensis TaxID=2910250 RepID=UPI003D1007A9
MNRGKTLLALSMACLLTAPIAHASDDDDQATSGDVTFNATIEEQCGIDVTTATAELAFGDTYNGSTAQVKLINNEKDGTIEFRLEPIDTEDLGDQVTKQNVYFKADGSVSDDMNAREWEEGIEFSRDDLKSNNYVNLSARINIDESNLDADDYALVTNWIIECDD